MDKNHFIISQPQTYFETQSKSLQERLNNVKIDENKECKIINEKTVKTIRDKALGLFKIGDVISTVLNWNCEIDKEIDEAKKAILLEQYFNRADKQEDAINKLRIFLTNPQGNVLFNKILRILDDSPPDQELIYHLSSVLKYITDDDNFYKMFEKHKFALSQIEKLTPQALTILADYKNYPTFKLGSAISFGPKVTSEWNVQFVNAYCLKKGISSQEFVTRVSHVITQLQTQGYIEAYKTQENLFACEVSSIGRDLLPYLTS